MKKLLNTLYVTTPESYLSKDGLNIVISVRQQEVFRIPIVNIEQIITFGYMGASPGLMKLCADNGVSLTFLSPNGRFIGRFQGPVTGNVLLRTRQYRLTADPDYSLSLARIFIAAKINNYRQILLRHLRDYGSEATVEEAERKLNHCKGLALKSTSSEELRGHEGDAASVYFSVFPRLLRTTDPVFRFNGRNRRPPRDAVNCMLSFVYTLITNDCTAALDSVGLDPYVGLFHTLRPGRPSLALDIMEEMRAYLGDRLVLSLINRRQINGRDFISQGEDSVTATDEGRKTILQAWQQRKKEIIMHPFLKEKIPIGLLPYVQSQLLARTIRDSIDMARECVNYGHRVQNSVFECVLTEAQFIVLREKLKKLIDNSTDSIRFYFLGNNWERHIESIGLDRSLDTNSALII